MTLRNDVRQDWAWADTFLPAQGRILYRHYRTQLIADGEPAINAAPLWRDQQHAADKIMRTVDGEVTVACRVRRAKYRKRFPYDFTLRTQVASGGESEHQKILGGYGDLILYGFAASETDNRLSPMWGEYGAYFIGDLDHFRAANPTGQPVQNGDGLTAGLAFDRRHIPKFVVHEWGN